MKQRVVRFCTHSRAALSKFGPVNKHEADQIEQKDCLLLQIHAAALVRRRNRPDVRYHVHETLNGRRRVSLDEVTKSYMYQNFGGLTRRPFSDEARMILAVPFWLYEVVRCGWCLPEA